MYNYNCPECEEAKLQSDKNARKINEVIEQVNALIDDNNETVNIIEEKATEKVNEIAKVKVPELVNNALGEVNKELDNLYSSLDNITAKVNYHITNHPTGGSGTLNKLEILEVEPSGDELYEGRIWIYKAPDLSCTNITLSSSTLTFTNSNHQTLTYTTLPSNTTDNVTWSVNPSGIVSVLMEK